MQSEAEFKATTCAAWRKTGKYARVFFIETEETEKGFPDVIATDVIACDTNSLHLYEFKVSDLKGRIKFQKDQPRFYLKNKILNVQIVALDNRNGETHIFPASALFAEGKYKINEKQEVYL